MSPKYYIGVDVGKTNTKIVCLDVEDQLIFKKQVPSRMDSNKILFDFLRQVIADAKSVIGKEYESVGVCLPGLVNYKMQKFLYIPSVNSVKSFVARELALGINVKKEKLIIDNDCTSAAFGELKVGSLKNTNNSILLSIGTGFGFGLILNGLVYRGSNGFAGQIGHTYYANSHLKCKCGRKGCYETLIVRYEQLISSCKGSTINSRETENFVKALATLLSFTINLLNIECISLYGYPFSSACIKNKFISNVKKLSLNESFDNCTFVRSKLTHWAGAVGAALLSKIEPSNYAAINQ